MPQIIKYTAFGVSVSLNGGELSADKSTRTIIKQTFKSINHCDHAQEIDKLHWCGDHLKQFKCYTVLTTKTRERGQLAVSAGTTNPSTYDDCKQVAEHLTDDVAATTFP